MANPHPLREMNRVHCEEDRGKRQQPQPPGVEHSSPRKAAANVEYLVNTLTPNLTRYNTRSAARAAAAENRTTPTIATHTDNTSSKECRSSEQQDKTTAAASSSTADQAVDGRGTTRPSPQPPDPAPSNSRITYSNFKIVQCNINGVTLRASREKLD